MSGLDRPATGCRSPGPFTGSRNVSQENNVWFDLATVQQKALAVARDLVVPDRFGREVCDLVPETTRSAVPTSCSLHFR
jgi:hypothetical protein